MNTKKKIKKICEQLPSNDEVNRKKFGNIINTKYPCIDNDKIQESFVNIVEKGVIKTKTKSKIKKLHKIIKKTDK